MHCLCLNVCDVLFRNTRNNCSWGGELGLTR